MNTESNPKKPPASDSEMAQRFDSLVRESERLKAEITRARWIRGVLVLALLVLVGVTATSFINLGRQVGSERNVTRMAEIAGKKWESRAPVYRREIQEVFERATPVLTEAMATQLKADMPKLVQAATTEREALADGFAKGLEERVHRRYQDLLAGHQKIIREEFPEINDEKLHEQMLANLTVAVDQLVERYYVTNIERTSTELMNNWDEFPAADPPKAGEDPLQDQLLGALAELVALRLSTTDNAETVQR